MSSRVLSAEAGVALCECVVEGTVVQYLEPRMKDGMDGTINDVLNLLSPCLLERLLLA
jgi:hypothetical protein